MEPFKTRGYIFGTTLKYCREGLPPAKSKKVLEAISPETLRFIESAKPTEWYDVAPSVDMLEAIAKANDGDEKAIEQDLIGCGKFAANEATNTFLRLLMKVLTPSLFAKKLPALYERDNSKGKVHVDVTDDHLVCTIKDCLGYKHMGPMSVGWSTFALEAMGKQLSSSTIKGWSLATPDPGEITFELVWRS